MKQKFLAVKAFVYFGYNYPNPKEFIHYICEKTGKLGLESHLLSKFDHIYDVYGSHAVMNYFFTEIDVDLREALVEFACTKYYPKGFSWDTEGIELLGI